MLDLHALRHTGGVWLALAGAHPKAIQAVMRHSTITLTMDTYGHLIPGQEADTVARLPEMQGMLPRATKATGTTGDHRSITGSDVAPNVAPVIARDSGRLTTLDDGEGRPLWTQESQNRLQIQAIDDGRGLVTLAGEELPGQDSNLDKQNQNLLCYRYTTG